jgi:hypothetical protein
MSVQILMLWLTIPIHPVLTLLFEVVEKRVDEFINGCKKHSLSEII